MRTAAAGREPKRIPAKYGLAHQTLVDTPLGRGRTIDRRLERGALVYLVQFPPTYPNRRYRPGQAHWFAASEVIPVQEIPMHITIDDALLASAPSFNAISGPVIKLATDWTALPHDAVDHPLIYLPRHGLIFTAEPILPDAVPQASVLKACADCRIGGVADWDAPELIELQLLIDPTRHGPATNTDLLRLLPRGCIWTKTDAAWSRDAAGVASAAWGVVAGIGNVDCYRRDGAGIGLAVRRVGQ